jgi:hypothetical protein
LIGNHGRILSQKREWRKRKRGEIVISTFENIHLDE